MKPVLLSLFVIATLLSCDDNKSDSCNVSDPVNDLAWLHAEIEAIESEKDTDPMYQYRFFAQGYYMGKPVFFQSWCCPPCSMVPIVTLMDCEGQEVEKYDASRGKIRFQKTIWHADGFPCGN